MLRCTARAILGRVGQIRNLHSCPTRIASLPSLLQLHKPQLLQVTSLCPTITTQKPFQLVPQREFHARGSKVNYLDFRYRWSTCHWRSHLLIIRRQKMKKHKRLKWRKKYKCLLAKRRLKREIGKEKTFRVELLTMIRRAEQFDPREYALNKLREINNAPRPLTKQERFEELKELIRIHRYQVTYIKPKHRRPESLEVQ